MTNSPPGTRTISRATFCDNCSFISVGKPVEIQQRVGQQGVAPQRFVPLDQPAGPPGRLAVAPGNGHFQVGHLLFAIGQLSEELGAAGVTVALGLDQVLDGPPQSVQVHAL
jgi:hypothetical protein